MGLRSVTYPDALYVRVVHIGGGLVIAYELDFYERWIIHVRYVLGGLKFEDLFCEVVGKASEHWIENHFDDEDIFEDWEKFAE